MRLAQAKVLIFKPLSRIAKFFSQPLRCEVFFAGVALMENNDDCGKSTLTAPLQ